MKWFLDQYLPDKTRRSEPTVTPLNARLEQLTGLSPALMITAKCDVLRDEGEAYARKLMEAGVTVTVIDTETGREAQDRTVVISGERISDVRDSKRLRAPAGAKLVGWHRQVSDSWAVGHARARHEF